MNESIEYHWILTVQCAEGVSTQSGLISITPRVGTARAAYEEVLQAAKDSVQSDQVVVLFYSLTPNQVEGN